MRRSKRGISGQMPQVSQQELALEETRNSEVIQLAVFWLGFLYVCVGEGHDSAYCDRYAQRC